MRVVRRGVAWFARQRRRVQGAMVLSGLVVALILGSLGTTAFGHHGAAPGPQGTQPGGIARTRTGPAIPQTPRVTQTPTLDTSDQSDDVNAPNRLHGPTLGGTLSAFYARYGTPLTATATTADFQVTLAGVAVALSVETALGSDGGQHVLLIQFGPPAGAPGWRVATAQQVAGQLVPPDATSMRTAPASNGPDYVASSALLAATFPPTDFHNGTGTQPVSPGTFDYQCGATLNSQGGLAQCVMRPGQE
jgi:hypothetical protein